MSQTRNHHLSQHFLKSPRLALKLIGHSNLHRRDLVLEIGAGSGVITTMLARRVREVWAIEPDPVAAQKLRANLAKYHIENVRVIEQDFRDVELPREPYKVFANPPFHLSAEVFYKLLSLENRAGVITPTQPSANAPAQLVSASTQSANTPTQPANALNLPQSIYLILQKQLALKLIPTDRHYTSQLGRQIIAHYDARIRLPLQKTDFTPPPAVDTVLWEGKLRQTSA